MTKALEERTRLRAAPSVYARAFGSELVLLEFGQGEYFGLDEIGAEIWRQLETGKDLGTIADHVTMQYDVLRATALDDIVHLVTRLQDCGLLVPV